MPIPSGFDNTVRHVNATPIAASDINTELTTQNGAGYWCTDIKFSTADDAFLVFVKTDESTYGYPMLQKVNLVTQSQAALDADKATETANGYWPTGVFITPGGDLLVLYNQLTGGGS